MSKNPYANKDGAPTKGKESLFIDWELQHDRERIDALPDKEKKQEKKAATHIRSKMES